MNHSIKIAAIVILFIGSIIILDSCTKEASDDDTNYTIIWQEKFETYAINTFPSTWIKDGNATDIKTNFVTDVTSSEGNKSLKLFGRLGGCWGSIAYKGLETSSPYIVEVDIKNGDENLSGCHPNRAAIVVREGNSWTNPGRGFILFKEDGYIYLAGEKSDKYTPNVWYKVKIKYEKSSTTEIKLSFWINDDFKGDFTQPTISEENLLTNLEIAVEEGTAWFDNISVLK